MHSPYTKTVRAFLGRSILLLVVGALVLLPLEPASAGFVSKGDANNDGYVDISDAIRLFDWLAQNPDLPICLKVIDANEDGKVDYSDGIFLLYYMFMSGDAPKPYNPGTEPGCYGNVGSFELRNLGISVLSPTSVLIAWETPHPGDTRVEFGESSANLDGILAVDELSHYHQALLSDLEPATTYYFRVGSESEIGDSVSSDVQVLRTLPAVEYTVRAEHPRVFFSRRDLAELRARTAEGGSHRELWESLAGWCASKLATPTAEILLSENFVEYVRAFAFVGAVGNDKACREKALDLAMALTQATPEDELRGATESLAFVYDWLHDTLTSADKKAISQQLWRNCQILEGITQEHEFVTGWSHGNSKSLALGLLALAGDSPQADDFLQKVVDSYRNGFLATWRRFATADGGSFKNWWYTTYALTFELEFFAAFRSATGQDWFALERSWCENLIDWFLFGLRGDDSFPREGDAYVREGLEYQNRVFGSLLAKEYGNAQGQWFADQVKASVGIWSPQAVFDILWYDPEVVAEAPRGSTSRLFRNVGEVVCRESWSKDAAVATFRAPEVYTLGHSHSDSCSFTLYYKGDLAIDSGIYDEYGSKHRDNYYSRTVAHNTMLVFDPDEAFVKYGIQHVNDGGQRWLVKGEDVATAWPATAEDTVDRSKGFRMGGIPRYEADDLYTYAVGDGGPAYSSSKVKRFFRHFLWLKEVSGWDHPVLVILDDIAASQASLRKAYLLHTTQKPNVDGRLLTARDGEGVLYQWTLAPKEATLTLIGGPGKEFWVNGANYPPSRAPRGKEQPGSWRVEVSPVKKSAEDKFLHVLFPTDAGSVAPKEPPAFALGGMQGCIVGDWIIFFESGNAVETLTYDAALATSRHLISGAAPLAKYDLYVDGELEDTLTASFAGVLRFDLDAPGRVRLEPKI